MVGNGEHSIVARGIRHVYKGGTVALDGIDLQIDRGLFGLLGPNGAGKSTLMRIMCTLLVPTEGDLTVGGCDVRNQRIEVRRQLGYLPQEFSAWRLQRVEEVVDLLALLSGMTAKKERRARVREVLESVGLGDVADRKVKKLSGGMRRRLGVAQALVHDPPVIVVDEPTVGLDPEERLRFRKVMADLSQERTIVLSTHIVADLGSSCSDIALIDAGKIVFRGSPADLMRHAEGRVFEKVIAAHEPPDFGPGIEIVSRTRDGVGMRVRAVVADGEPPHGAQSVPASTLEEAYLAFMAGRGRADVALADVEAAQEGDAA